MAERGDLGNPVLGEIQVMSRPGRTRYITLTWLMAQFVFIAALLAVTIVAFAVPSASVVARVEFGGGRAAAVQAERTRHLGRFDALLGRYAELKQAALELDNRLCRITLVYGLEGAVTEHCGQAAATVTSPTGGNVDDLEPLLAAAERDVGHVLRRMEQRLRAAYAVEEEQPGIVALTPSTSPLAGDDFVLTAPFGEVRNGLLDAVEFHAGIDLAAPAGMPVGATAAGRVTYVGRGARLGEAYRRYGLLVAIRHGDRFITLFGHLDGTNVRAGDLVERGQRIGSVGETGWSAGPNLHYGVLRLRSDGGYVPVDPRLHMLDYRWRNEGALIGEPVAAPERLPRLPRTLLR